MEGIDKNVGVSGYISFQVSVKISTPTTKSKFKYLGIRASTCSSSLPLNNTTIRTTLANSTKVTIKTGQRMVVYGVNEAYLGIEGSFLV